MIRTQVQFTERQARRLRALARRRGISMAAVVRQCVDQALDAIPEDRSAAYERASRVVGRFADRDGATDVASDHDRYLDEVGS